MLAKTLEINKKKKRISNSKKFSIISYGCQMNVSDSEVVASESDRLDILILMKCTILIWFYLILVQ